MCLGIPGEVVELLDSNRHLATVDVAGVRRNINVLLLEDEGLAPGDWVLIHVGFAMSKIDEEEAALALASLQLMGQAYDDELEALWSSAVADEARGRPCRSRRISPPARRRWRASSPRSTTPRPRGPS